MTVREDVTAAVAVARRADRHDRLAAAWFAIAVALGRIPGPEPDEREGLA